MKNKKRIAKRTHAKLEQIVPSKHITHRYLECVKNFEVEFPKDFFLDTCSHDGFSYWNLNITDANFKSTLNPSKKYDAEIYRLKSGWGSNGLVEVGKKNKRIMGGALGGALLCSRYEAQLPTDRWVICLDEEKHLWRNAHGLHVPAFVRSNGGWSFDLIVGSSWFEGSYIVFYREMSDSQV